MATSKGSFSFNNTFVIDISVGLALPEIWAKRNCTLFGASITGCGTIGRASPLGNVIVCL
jgi:hypothetical protein